ncbi:MAG: efflux RND transporter periplasmic adaptor subunit [Methylocystis sp.]
MDDKVSLPDHDKASLSELETRGELDATSDAGSPGSLAIKAAARRSPIAILLGLIIVALLGYATYRVLWPKEQPRTRSGRAAGGIQPVGVATVARGDIKINRDGLGNVTPIANVIMKTQLNGYLTQVAFKEGQMVKKGDFLAQIDPRPYEVLKQQYEGQLRHDQGFLDQARADLKRYSALLKQDSIARQQAENQIWVVKQYEGSVKSDQAQVDNQALNLTYAHIVAPITGRVGLRQVDAGSYVTTGDANGIVLITQIDPISVIFSIGEDYVQEIIAGVKANGELQVTALDRSNVNVLAVGKLDTLDNTVDTTTGMFKLRAEFENKDDKLFPNQFVNVRVLVGTRKNVLVMPSAAIQTGATNGSFAYVVREDNKVAVQPIVLGVSDAGMVEIKSGLQEGDKVVIDGADRLRDGAEIKIADGKPGTDAAPPRVHQKHDREGADGEKRDRGDRPRRRHRDPNWQRDPASDKPDAGGPPADKPGEPR